MRYTKLLLSASLLITSAVFAADVSKTRQIASFPGTNLPEARIQFAKKGTTADLAREILSQVKVPTGAEITVINLGQAGILPISEDTMYNVDIPFYQPNRVVVYLKMPSLAEKGMDVIKISVRKEDLRDYKGQLTVPKSGKIIDIKNAYKKAAKIPEDFELSLWKEGYNRLLQDNDSYTTEDLNGKPGISSGTPIHITHGSAIASF
jgi:hypothetical protein